MKRIKLAVSLFFVVAVIASLATQAFGLPQFLSKAKKFGAKDCTFCHEKASGGEPLNARGQWLRKEKERRGAETVDPEWLADYKEGK